MSRGQTPDMPAPGRRRTVSVRLADPSYRRLRIAAAEKGMSMGQYLAELWETSEPRTRPRKSSSNG